MPEIKDRRERGETLPEIVEWLNQQGHTTTAGKPFTQTAVWRLIDRYLGKEYLGSTRKKTTGSKVGDQRTSGILRCGRTCSIGTDRLDLLDP